MQLSAREVNDFLERLDAIRAHLSAVKFNTPDERSALLEVSYQLDDAIAELESYNHKQTKIFQELNQHD